MTQFLLIVNTGHVHGRGKKLVMVVSITVSMLLMMLLVLSYVYIIKPKLKGKILSIKSFQIFTRFK